MWCIIVSDNNGIIVSTNDILQDPQWLPETVASIKSHMYYVSPVIKFNSYIRLSKRITTGIK